MTTNQIIGLIVGIIILLVVIGLLVQMGRRRKVEADRTKAAELREEGDRTRLQASELEANSASADAQARQARVEAEKLEREADTSAKDAQATQARAQEHDERAAQLDPDSPEGVQASNADSEGNGDRDSDGVRYTDADREGSLRGDERQPLREDERQKEGSSADDQRNN